MTRPNILFAIADDASHFGAYGHRFVNTPNFDRVAAEGVRFDNAFTTNPKCAPSRASILTGMHTWQLEDACTHWCVFPAKFACYPDLLESSGYHVGYTGKGWAPGDWKRGGRERNPAGPEYNNHHLQPPENSGISSRDYAADFAGFLAARPEGAPFCFWYGASEPHRAYVHGEGEAHGKSMDEIDELPPYWPQTEAVRRDLLDYAFEIEWFDRQLGAMLEQLEEAGELDRTLVVVTSDNGCPFPRVKGQMYEDDLRLPLAARWPEMTSGGRVVEDLVSFIDFAPTFLEAAGYKVPDSLPGQSLFDIFKASGSGVAAGRRQRVFMGRERHDLGREGDKGYPVRCLRTPRHLYVRNYAPDRWPAGNPETGFTNCDSSPVKETILALRERGDGVCYALCFGKRPAEELYDIREDPHCMANLAEKREYAQMRDSLRTELEAELEITGDPRARGEGDIFDSYEYVAAPEESLHSWANSLAGTWQPQRY